MPVDSFLAAFLAGLGTGAHCAFMCGPLACALKVKPLEYHLARIVAYTLVGGLCGGFGQLVLKRWSNSPLHLAPWVLVLVFLVMATGLERRIPVPAFVSRWSGRIRLERNLGWLTPLIPCGPLWLMFGAAAATGEVLAGATLLLWFAWGTVALYALAQCGFASLQKNVAQRVAPMMQRGFLWLATLLLAWRLWNGGGHGCCSL